jgi:hypothetical protein
MTKQPYRQQILYGEDNTTVVDIIFIVSTEAKFLDVIGTNVLIDFLRAIHTQLYYNPLERKWFETGF